MAAMTSLKMLQGRRYIFALLPIQGIAIDVNSQLRKKRISVVVVVRLVVRPMTIYVEEISIFNVSRLVEH